MSPFGGHFWQPNYLKDRRSLVRFQHPNNREPLFLLGGDFLVTRPEGEWMFTGMGMSPVGGADMSFARQARRGSQKVQLEATVPFISWPTPGALPSRVAPPPRRNEQHPRVLSSTTSRPSGLEAYHAPEPPKPRQTKPGGARKGEEQMSTQQLVALIKSGRRLQQHL